MTEQYHIHNIDKCIYYHTNIVCVSGISLVPRPWNRLMQSKTATPRGGDRSTLVSQKSTTVAFVSTKSPVIDTSGNRQTLLLWLEYVCEIHTFFKSMPTFYSRIRPSNPVYYSCFILLCFCFVLVLVGFTHIVKDYVITTYCTRKLRSGVSAIWVGNLSLRWRHNERDGLSNHQRNDCLLKRLSRRRSKKTWKLRVTGLCAGNSSETKGQYRGKCFHLMTSSSDNYVSDLFILQPFVCEIRRRACQRSFELF